MTGRRGRRRKQLLDHLKEKNGYWKLKEEELDLTLWKTGCVRGYLRIFIFSQKAPNGRIAIVIIQDVSQVNIFSVVVLD